MKKSYMFAAALFSSVSILFTGCSLPEKDVNNATEYVGDGASQDESEQSNEAAAEKSIVVINDLFEPVIEEKSSSEASSQEEAAAEATEPEAEEVTPVNIVFFGDSQLANGRDDGTDIPHLLGKRVPNSRIFNLAIGGTTASVEQSTSDVSPENLASTSFLGMAYSFAGKSDRNAALSSYPDILDTMNSIDPADVDYYILSYGTNDFLNGVPLDVDNYQPESVQAHALYNSMNKAIEALEDVSPDAEFIILTPFYGLYVAEDGSYIGDSYIVSNGIGTLADYADKVKNVAESKDAQLFDGMYQSRFDLYLDTANDYLMDNLHLTLTGRQIVARLLAHNVNMAEKNEPYAYLDTDYIKIADFDPDENYRYDESQMKANYPDIWENYTAGKYPLAQPSEEAAAEYSGE